MVHKLLRMSKTTSPKQIQRSACYLGVVGVAGSNPVAPIH
jgi:hypothetical protein